MLRLAALALSITFVCVAAYAAVPPCPTRLTVIGCRIEPGHYVADMAKEGVEVLPSKDWQDMQWKLDPKIGGLDCVREVIELQDSALLQAGDTTGVMPLHPNFSDAAQCAHAAMGYAMEWSLRHPGYWATAACPSRVVNIRPDGSMETIGWQDMSCPNELAGLPVVCRETNAI